MSDAAAGAVPPARRGRQPWAVRLGLSPRFHAFCARVPGLRHIARSEGAALFDIVQGFVQSQALLALVELRVLHRLAEGPVPLSALAGPAGVPAERMAILCKAGAGLGLMACRRGMWRLTVRGAAFLTVPGLEAMVRHHPVLYRDLADPVAFFRGETQPELAGFWPYVFGAGGAADPELAARYSALMADSQGLVAADTLRMVDLRGVRHLMDVGGGTGAFLAAAGTAHPALRMTLFDLPAVVPAATARFAAAGMAGRVEIVAGSFRDDPLPRGADAVSLVRVLYDHSDATVAALLRAVHDALPAGGRIVVSEPMSGGDSPDPATDVYFSVYTLAMQTGRTRSGAEIARMLVQAGFSDVKTIAGFRPYVTSVVTAARSFNTDPQKSV
ncbi:methyltransferase domain-containing protein [Rhodobacteraceae bacterium HSP-20]|uniref:Methyltransferase domain-containing protein n=1 Tax=Paragemmobacter amnigenus TaxID=2852097 RepID=A0ABS6IYB5_9RHOB|nr:methyltransferase [Rhodobacter amnigenus]MBU9696503.1 methyltransferase domain-containing protein [Rhodobacter amnigenus]MBV4387730.1 methyltransferase domain-containing protein [Rhodobacter amnigenus]